MTITYRHFESPEDLNLQYDFWIEATRTLPYAWKPTKSPKQFFTQKEFHPKSRLFAFDGKKLVGYMSFTGKGDFVSLGYPWVLPEYKYIQDELFHQVYSFATSKEYGGKVLAQRFRKQWEDQIHYFLNKGFEITNSSPIVGRKLNETLLLNDDNELTYEIKNDFEFPKWKAIKEASNNIGPDELEMMKEYYSSVDFNFSIHFSNAGRELGYFGITIRPDTGFSEIIAVGLSDGADAYILPMLNIISKESLKRGASVIAMYKSELPDEISLNDLLFEVISEDVMMFNRL
jgi:hypothetical protein